MSLFRSNKCQICKVRRKQRFCLRTGKDICWECCNELRQDFKCNKECRYALIETKEALNFQTNADSQLELTELTKKLIDNWSLLPQKDLDGKIPFEMSKSEAGRIQLIKYFNLYDISAYPAASYIKDKLNLKELKISKQSPGFEDIARSYMKHLLIKDHNGTISSLAEEDRFYEDKIREDYLEGLRSDTVLKKIKDFKQVSSAVGEDKKQALVYFDVNGRYDLTVKLLKVNGIWQIKERIMGRLEVVNGESDAIQQVALLLTRKEMVRADELLKKYLSIFPDSADLNYHKGLYEYMHKRIDKAGEYFFRASWLDNSFTEAVFNFAIVKHQKGELDEAETNYKKAERLNDEDVRIKSNLAALYIDKLNLDSAEEYLEKGRKIDPEFKPLIENFKRFEQIKSNRED